MFKSIRINKVPLVLSSFLCMLLTVVALNTNEPNILDTTVSAEIDNAGTVEVPIIMYHAVSDVADIQGEFVISPTEFENDLKYLKENGYNTIFIADIVNYINKNTPLPENPIALTFDDGYYNNYLYVYPLLQKYNSKATISPIAYYSDLYSENGEIDERYSHCTWSQLNEMSKSGLFEFANHSYNLHTTNSTQEGVRIKTGESIADYKHRIKEDFLKAQKLIEDNTGKKCTVFTYPFGLYSEGTVETLKELGYTAILTCDPGVNHLCNGDTELLYNLKRLIRPHNCGIENIVNN